MNVLVTGATGFLGKYVVQALLDDGHHARAIVRPGRDVHEFHWPDSVEIHRADLAGNDDLAQAMDGIDAVMHLATPVFAHEAEMEKSGVDGTKRLLEAMIASDCNRLIHASSISVYDWLKVGNTLDEKSPIDNDMKHSTYSRIKGLQERMVKQAEAEHGLKVTILRPGMIWGPGRMDMFFIGGSKPLWFIIGPKAIIKDTYVENCANLFVKCLHDKATGKTFNVVDGTNTINAEYVREYMKRTGKSAIRLPIPYIFGYSAALIATGLNKLFGGRLPQPGFTRLYEYQLRFKPAHVSIDAVKQTLSWTPLYSFEESMDRVFVESTLKPPPQPAEASV